MKRNLSRVLAAIVVLSIFITGWGLYHTYSPLPDWIFLITFGSGSLWVAEYIGRLFGKKGFWGSVRSQRDKIVMVCSFAVMWTFCALPIRLGISALWVRFLAIVTGGWLGCVILRRFSSPDITRPDKPRMEADEG